MDRLAMLRNQFSEPLETDCGEQVSGVDLGALQTGRGDPQRCLCAPPVIAAREGLPPSRPMPFGAGYVSFPVAKPRN